MLYDIRCSKFDILITSTRGHFQDGEAANRRNKGNSEIKLYH